MQNINVLETLMRRFFLVGEDSANARLKGWASHGDAIAIRATPDGRCCVAQGNMVHVYDWTMDSESQRQAQESFNTRTGTIPE